MHPQICLSLKSTKTRLLILNGESEKITKVKNNRWVTLHNKPRLHTFSAQPLLHKGSNPIQTKLIPKLTQNNPTPNSVQPKSNQVQNRTITSSNWQWTWETKNLQPILNQLISLFLLVHRNELIRSSFYPLFKQQYIDNFVSEQRFITAHEQQLSNPHLLTSVHSGEWLSIFAQLKLHN